MGNIFKIIKNFLFSKFAIAVIFLAIGVGFAQFTNFLNNQRNATDSTFKNFSIWLKSSKNQVENSKIFSFNGEKFVLNIKKSLQKTVDKTTHTIDQTQENIVKKVDKITNNKQLKNDQQQPVKQEIKSAEVRRYEDQFSYSYDLVLIGYRYEDVIIAINNDQLNFSSTLNSKPQMVINDIYYQDASIQSFYHSLDLPKYNHKKEPEILYKNNIITVKFFK